MVYAVDVRAPLVFIAGVTDSIEPQAGTAKIHNTATGRIHVAWFSRRPWPGGDRPGVVRWSSRAHHTAGAATDVEADEHMAALRKHLAALGYPSAVDLGAAEWDGDGVPAMTILGSGASEAVRS